jgi:hypothetical protein
MAHWILLSPEKAHSFYRVPLSLTTANGNLFYGTAHDPRDNDGPWPLVAFLREQDWPRVITLQIYTIEAEERTAPSFDPISQGGGHLNLQRECFARLGDLLRSEAAKLPAGAGNPEPMFHRIDDARLSDFGLSRAYFPNTADQYYRQTYDPLQVVEDAPLRTVLIFSTGQSAAMAARLYFKIAQFPRHALANPSFDVLDDSIARINLNRAGAKELAALLEAQTGK